MENLKKFLSFLNNNEEAANQIKKILEENQSKSKEELSKLILDFAKENGFNIPTEEIEELRKKLEEHSIENVDDLTLEDLDEVSGGSFLGCLIAMGIGVVVMSLIV